MTVWPRRLSHPGLLPAWCAAIVMLLYGDALTLPFFFDDFVHLPYVDAFSLPAMWTSAGDLAYYRPLSFTIWKVMQLVVGTNDPVWQHAFNLVVHAVNGWLVGWLAAALWPGPAARLRAYLAATLFLLFPFSYQAVPWIGALSHLLVSALILGALAAYWQGRTTGRRRWYALSLLAAALAPFAHENGVLMGPLLALMLLTRPDVDWRSLRWLRPSLLWTLPALLWLPIWWLAPKALTGNVRLNGLEAILQNVSYFAQGAAYPVTWIGGWLRDGLGWNDVVAVWSLVLLGLGAAALILRGRFGRRQALPWLWAALVIWPAVLFLRFDYVINGPRLLMLVGVAAAWLWSDVLLTFLAPAGAPRRIVPRWLVAGALLLLVLGQNVAFIRVRMDVHHRLGQAYDQITTVTQAANEAGAPALLINVPSWITPPRATYALGHEGVQFWPDYAQPADLVAVQTGRPAMLDLIRVNAIRLDLPYFYGVAGGAPQWSDRAAGHVYVADYSPVRIDIRPVGRLMPGPPATGVAQFALPENPEDPVLELADVVTAAGHLELTWRARGPLPPDVTVFVHFLAEGGSLAAQADGDPLAGTFLLADLTPGESLVDIRSLPPAPAAAPMLVGVYRRVNGQRLLAATPAGDPYPANAVPLGVEVP